MADGISAVDIGMLLFDVEPKDEIVRTEEPWAPADAALAAPRCSGSPAQGFVGMFAGAARWLWSAREGPGKAWNADLDGVVGLWEVGWNLTKPAPKVAFNTDIGPDAQLRLDDRRRWASSNRSRTRSAAPSTTSPWRSPRGALRRWLRGPRRRRRRARAEGAGPGLDPDRERARRARQQADRDARAAAGRHRRPGRAPARRHRARWTR